MSQYSDDAPEQAQVQDDAQVQSPSVNVGKLPDKYDDFFTEAVSPSDKEAPEQTEEEPLSDDWEHKYKVLKGKYDKEVPRLNKELRMLRQEKENISQRMALLEQVVAEVMSRSSRQSSAPAEPVIEEDEDVKRVKSDYPEIYNAVTKLVEKKLTREVRPELDQVKATTAQSAFYGRLDTLLPEWRAINSDPEFLEWLSQPSDELPTKTKHQLLMIAFNEGDANAVASFFRRFISSTKRTSDGEEVTAVKTQAEKSVAPPYRKTAQSGKESSKKIYTESEIKQFYTDLALNKIPADKKGALEQQILQAIMDNRVLYGK